jgi:hypothetical protein
MDMAVERGKACCSDVWLLLAACDGPGQERTIRVVSTRDDQPIAGVNVELRAVSRPFGDYYGPRYDKQVWSLTTDASGEVQIHQPGNTQLYVDVGTKHGYEDGTQTIRNYEKQRKYFDPELAGANWRDTYYLAPHADYHYEAVRYAYRVAADKVDGKVHDTGAPISIIVNYYSLARKHTLSERELPPLRQFCRFYELTKAEAANGWPTLHVDFSRRQAMRLLGDCAAAGLTTPQQSTPE